MLTEIASAPYYVRQRTRRWGDIGIRQAAYRQTEALYQKGMEQGIPTVEPQTDAYALHLVRIYHIVKFITSARHVAQLAQAYAAPQGVLEYVQIEQKQL